MSRKMTCMSNGVICLLIIFHLCYAHTSNLGTADISQCCSFIGQYESVLQCMNTTSFQDVVLNEIVLATFFSDEIKSFAFENALFNLHYAQEKHYHLRLLSSHTGDDYFPEDRRWNKIKAITSALTGWAKKCAYVVFIDSDLIFVNWDFDVQSVIFQYPGANVILAADSIDIANTGFMIVRNSEWSIEFLQKWWDAKGTRNTFCDQHVLNQLLHELSSSKDKDKVAVVPPKLINSQWPSIANFEDSDPILHLMGETNETRNKISTYVAQRVCALPPKKTTGLAQRGGNVIGLTRQVLKELRMSAMMSIWERNKAKCSRVEAADKEFEALHENIGQICDTTKLGDDSVLENNAICMELMNDAYQINHIALEATRDKARRIDEKDAVGAAVISQKRLLHLNQMTMLLFDMFKRPTGDNKIIPSQNIKENTSREIPTTSAATTTTAAPSASKTYLYLHDKMLAAQRVLGSLEALARELDMGLPSNQAYVHHKRGVVFGSLSEYDLAAELWQDSLDKEKVAISEFGAALSVTTQDCADFPGFVMAYVHSASRLAVAFRGLQRGAEAYEWGTIALNNIKLLYAGTSNEERLMMQELSTVHSICAEICADLLNWNEYNMHIDEINNLSRLYKVN